MNITVSGSKEPGLDISAILSDLKSERDRLDRAIRALEGLGGEVRASGAATAGKTVSAATAKGRGLTPEGRRRLSEMMKKRWAERRKKG